MLKDNLIAELSKQFALRIIKLYKYLLIDKKEYIMSKQVYRAGTSIGANIAESKNAQSKADFISKLSIALKEASETEYWLELLCDSETISEKEFKIFISGFKCDYRNINKNNKENKREYGGFRNWEINISHFLISSFSQYKKVYAKKAFYQELRTHRPFGH